MTKEKLTAKHPIIENILDFLNGAWEMLPEPFETPYEHMKRMARIERGIPEPKQWEYNRAIRYLESQKQIKILNENGKRFIKLTKKGRLNGLFKKLSRHDFVNKKWDGKWRLMIWDIPESSRQQRDAIRFFVKKLGFYQLQRSVFITPFELPKDAVDYLKESGLIEFIRFLRVDRLDHAESLERHFKLL